MMLNISLPEIEELSKQQGMEETFMKFLRFISILDKEDILYIEGQKLMTFIF